MDPKLKAELTSREKWKRLLLIVVYALMVQIAEIALAITIVVQFVTTLFTGTPNAWLRDFGSRVGAWVRQAIEYATWASDAKPWPFGNPWPRAPKVPMRRPEDLV
ncbi:MAG: DUF4389 domain-containing protein [Halofilum sp. (in: g-proteobacteria)]